MTFEEFQSFHNQWAASMEQNMGALVEAQQRNEQEIQRLEKVVDGVAQILAGSITLWQDVTRRMDQLAQQSEDRGRRLDERMDRLTERIDRLTESVQRFLDAQARRNGGE